MSNDMSFNLGSWMKIAQLLAKINHFRKQYDFSFQIWSEDQLNVFVERGGVEIHSSGGFDSIEELFEYTVKWCEKANPSTQYPTGIEMTNPEPEEDHP